MLLAADLSRARRREVVDKVAAAIILRRWLDKHPQEVGRQADKGTIRTVKDEE